MPPLAAGPDELEATPGVGSGLLDRPRLSKYRCRLCLPPPLRAIRQSKRPSTLSRHTHPKGEPRLEHELLRRVMSRMLMRDACYRIMSMTHINTMFAYRHICAMFAYRHSCAHRHHLHIKSYMHIHRHTPTVLE